MILLFYCAKKCSSFSRSIKQFFSQKVRTTGMCQRGGGQGGAHAPPDYGRSVGAALLRAPKIFRLWHMPEQSWKQNTISVKGKPDQEFLASY